MYKLTDTYTLSNGIQIPCFGLGTYLSTADEGKTSITAAIDAGYRLIDTASRYANEDVVGNAIKDCEIPRKEIFVTSKVWNDCRGYDNVMRSFERTMKAIGLEYIDLLLVHWPANKKQYGDAAEMLNAETWRAFEDIYAADVVKAIGVANYKEHHLEELMKTARVKPMVNQIEVHPGFPRLDLVEYCQKNEIIIEAWGPLGGNGGACLNDNTIVEIAKNHGKSAAQICGRWLVQRGIIPLVKSVKPQRIIENAAVFDFDLTEGEMEAIAAITVGYGLCLDPDLIDF